MQNYQINVFDNYFEIIFLGDLTIDDTQTIKKELKKYLSDSKIKNIIVNLEKVKFMDSSGLGLLISLFKEVNEQQGEIVYFGIQDYVAKLLEMVKLNQIFKLAESHNEAKKSF